MVTIAQALAAAVVLRRLSGGRSRKPPLAAAAAPEPVSVVIPARDEAARIGPCLAALERDPDVREVLVVVDDEEDPTAGIAHAHGAAVIVAPPLPDGWVGKPWALQHGLEHAAAGVVVCLDADVRPKPGLMGAVVVALEDADYLSCGPRFVCETTGERLLQPSMLASLVYRWGPGDVDDPVRVIANGQCHAVRREWFLAQGGHHLSVGFMTDDIALARALRARGHRVAFRDGADLLDVKMYDSVGEVWRGWGRSLSAADVLSRREIAGDLAVVWLVMALPVLRMLARRGTRLDRALLALRWAMAAGTARAFDRRDAAYWLSPLADPLTAVRLTQAVVRPERTWRGRTYG